MIKKVLSLLLLCAFTQTMQAQTDRPATPTDYWAEASMELHVEQGTGDAWEWIRSHARDSQFVLFGEQHGIAGIPRLTALAYTELQDLGYGHLALEMSPWLGEQMSQNGVTPVLEAHPYELAFSYDAMVSLLEHTETVTQGPTPLFWGLDQPVTAIHGYKRLGEILPTARSRRMARGLHLKAVLQGGRYIRSEHGEDFNRLRAAAGPALSDEADLLLSSMETSMDIYLAYFAGQSGAGPRGRSDEMREPFMMQNLAARIEQVEAATGTLPRVLVLMGGAHIMEGIGPNGVLTLGDKAQKIASDNDLDALNIQISSYRDGADHSPPPSIFTSGDAALVDLRKIRATTTPEWIASLSPSLRKTVLQYDAAIYLRGELARADTQAIMSGRKRQFRQGLIATLGLAAAFIAVLLTLIIIAIRAGVNAIHPNLSLSFLAPGLPWIWLSGVSVATIILFVVQILRLREPAALNAMLSVGTPIFFGMIAVAVATVIVTVVAWKNAWWGIVSRSHYTALSAALIGLIWYMTHWSIGGMLG